jgi:hypothetical protein
MCPILPREIKMSFARIHVSPATKTMLMVLLPVVRAESTRVKTRNHLTRFQTLRSQRLSETWQSRT